MTASRTTVAALAVACAGSLGFIIAFLASAGIRAEGAAFALAAAGLAVAATAWGRLLPQQTVTDTLDDYPSSAAERRAAAVTLEADLREVSRRAALARWLSAAGGLFALALLVPLRALGPAPGRSLFGTKWRSGLALCDEGGRAVRAGDLNVDATVTVFPEGAVGDAQSQAVLIRLPAPLAPGAGDFVAYSRVCTHAGCPVALYRAADKQLLCPCHQSVFDVVHDGAVVSGPADRALPRLPVVVAKDGTLRAAGGFAQPVGPGFWERA